METRYTPDIIQSLRPNEVFVFGSNLQGYHQGGAACTAMKHFGAVWGVGVGLQGQSYAIPTMQGGVETIKPYIDRFLAEAKARPELTFYVTPIGCGIAGFKPEDIAPMFDEALDIGNIILPKVFVDEIRHRREVGNDEMSGLTFHHMDIKFYPEDEAKAGGMTQDEKIKFYAELKSAYRYSLVHKSPESDSFVLNTDSRGRHVIAIADKAFAIAVGRCLYSNLYEWGLDLGQNICSVVTDYSGSNNYPYGQFIVLLEDGSINSVWSELCIKPLSDERGFISVATGCGGLVFGLRKDGTVASYSKEGESAVMREVSIWTDVKQIEAGPRHVAGLRRDGTVLAAGKASACMQLKEWIGMRKIYVSKVSPIFGKENDLTFGIDEAGWLHVCGDCWPKGKEFWKRIQAQYDVADVIENAYAVYVRMLDGTIRCVTYYNRMDYMNELEFVNRYPGLRFMDAYGSMIVLVDRYGEFRVLCDGEDVSWWRI